MGDSRSPPQSGANFQHCRWHPQPDPAALQQAALTRILAAASAAREERGRFLIVLAGGETPRGIYRQLRLAETDWSAWHIYFGDERCLPPRDAARNSRMAGEAWLDHVPIPAGQIHPIPAELGPRRASAAYAALLQEVGDFDLVLLGLGEDGHTASLFPGHNWGVADHKSVLAVLDAPKPPPQRVSLSAARLARTRQMLFLVAGRDKRNAVAGWQAGKNIPPRHLTPAAGIDVLVEAALLFPER